MQNDSAILQYVGTGLTDRVRVIMSLSQNGVNFSNQKGGEVLNADLIVLCDPKRRL